MKIETQCLHAGYTPGNGDPRVVPIVQSTTYTFDSTAHIAALFDMPTEPMYSRFANPTVDAVEQKIAALEGGVAAMCTTSGQAANLLSILNVCKAGDSFISTGTIYGGTVNLFSVTLKKLGIECIFVDQEASREELQKAVKPNTRCVFGETLANPALAVLDIRKFADFAHDNGLPLIVDNTFPSGARTSSRTPPRSTWTATRCRAAASSSTAAPSRGITENSPISPSPTRAITA